MRLLIQGYPYLLVFLMFWVSSCSKPPVIKNVQYDLGPFKDRVVQVDLADAVSKGIEIPTQKQIPSGYFKVSFQIKPTDDKKYFYKIYYQNESYKISEDLVLAGENFYGSWEDVSIGFKPITDLDKTIVDSIRIVGNPRDEKIYYGDFFDSTFYSQEDIKVQAEGIKNNPEWFASMKSKAQSNSITVEEQLMQDAKWVLLYKTGKEKTNNRWKRNPRMGRYSLLIVLTTEEDLKKIPQYIQHVNLTVDTVKNHQGSGFISPYSFFCNKINSISFPGTTVFRDDSFITAKASLNLSAGIYANGLEYPGTALIPDSGTCGWNRQLYQEAHFSQFFSGLQKNTHLNTIPLIKDVNDSSYTLQEYIEAVKKYPADALKKDYIRNTQYACAQVRYNEDKNAIEIVNPGNKSLSEAYKSNMGIKTRIGFTYGKITAKIKFPELINKYNVWNGLTNAFWLLYQSENKWNERRTCKTGYTIKGNVSNDVPRFLKTNYSEIDFEMVKTSRYWPSAYYRDNLNKHIENAQQNDDIVLACTNWDLNCKDCKEFSEGVDTTRFMNEFYETNRWEKGQAITTRTTAKDDILFKSPYYYYQFEWTPDYIIWRVGPEKDKLKIVCCMDNNVTNIPTNQMIAIITQEYHISEWWPPIPFKQEYIPFPQHDIVGEVYEITIE